MIAVVFDFDGVLVDSEPLHLRAFQDVFAARGWALDAEAYAERYLGYDDLDLVRSYVRDRGLRVGEPEVRSLAAEKAELFQRAMAGGELLYPAAAACVARLGDCFPLAIASGSLHAEIEDILARAGLRGAFRAIVGADDVARSKPAPDSYRRAVELLGVAPAHAVAIEDTSWGLASARAAGLRAIGLTSTSPRDALAAADRIVDSLDAVTPGVVRALVGPLAP